MATKSMGQMIRMWEGSARGGFAPDRCNLVASAVSGRNPASSVEVEGPQVALRPQPRSKICRRLAHARGGAPRSGGL